MILVLSHPQDLHAAAVMHHLAARGETVFLWDLSEFPRAQRLRLACGDAGAYRLLDTPHGTVDLDEVRSAWWRRPQPYGVDPAVTDPEHYRFAHSECHDALAGLWQSLRATWVNDPVKDEAAGRKSRQLALAVEVGLRVPRTLITNDPRAARSSSGHQGSGSSTSPSPPPTPPGARRGWWARPSSLASTPSGTRRSSSRSTWPAPTTA